MSDCHRKAYPTGARERQKQQEKYDKAEVVRTSGKYPTMWKYAKDDCGEDRSSIVPNIDKY